MATPSELRQRAMDLEGEADALEAEQAKVAAEAAKAVERQRKAYLAFLRRRTVELGLLEHNEAYVEPFGVVELGLALERAFERLEPTP